MSTVLGVITTKPGVAFTTIAPAGFRILAALSDTAAALQHDLIITSACDGEHSGPADPHHTGEAYDIRTHDLDTNLKTIVLRSIMQRLGWDHFYGFLESPGTPNEHIHVQRRKDTIFP